jgi:pimeloyl-ACP methyl ester carboxylesterase
MPGACVFVHFTGQGRKAADRATETRFRLDRLLHYFDASGCKPCPGEAAVSEITRLFDYDSAVPLDVEVRSTVQIGNSSVADISYDDSTGRRAVASVVSRPGVRGSGIVIAHGGSADGRHYFLPEATALAELGFTVLLTASSFPRHGDIAASTEATRANILTQRRGLDVLVEWAGADAGRLGFFGHSSGAFQGAWLSAVEPRLTGLALVSGGSGTLVRVAESDLKEAESDLTESEKAGPYLTYLHRFDPAHFVAVAGRRRLLFQHGSEDPVVPLAEARRLYEAAAPPRRWREYPCDHGTTAVHPQAQRDRAEFFSSL